MDRSAIEDFLFSMSENHVCFNVCFIHFYRMLFPAEHGPVVVCLSVCLSVSVCLSSFTHGLYLTMSYPGDPWSLSNYVIYPGDTWSLSNYVIYPGGAWAQTNYLIYPAATSEQNNYLY